MTVDPPSNLFQRGGVRNLKDVHPHATLFQVSDWSGSIPTDAFPVNLFLHRKLRYHVNQKDDGNLKKQDVPDEIEPGDWTLRVTGAVPQPLHLEREELEKFPVETVTLDFRCAEGWRAEDISWRGVRVTDVIDRADQTVEDGYVLVHAADGDYACSFPLDRVGDALLAFELDGETLPVEHGGPVRFVPTDRSECWESVKWVSELEVIDSEPVAENTAREIALERLE